MSAYGGQVDVIVTLAAAVVGVGIGALLTRRNERRAHADRLLADTLDDLVSAIADVANGDPDAQRRYAGATARLALHASPRLVETFRNFQMEANTVTTDGRRRLVAAIQGARRELGRPEANAESASILLFGQGSDTGSQRSPYES